MPKASFNDRDYTRDAVIKQLGLIELHCKDGSAMDAGCQCIDTKHLYLIEGLAEEGMGFALSAKERQFYEDLGNFVRLTRKRMEVEDYDLHGVMRKTMKVKHPDPLRVNPGNPGKRKYLPHGLTACEKKYSSVRKKLSSCIRQTEKKPGAYVDFSPVAVCRASIKCPPTKSGVFELPKNVDVTYSEEVKHGESTANLDNGQISVVLNPDLKKDKKAHDIILQHEVVEAVCNLKTASACHGVAVSLGGSEEAALRERLATPP